jgi:hypothetical protein
MCPSYIGILLTLLQPRNRRRRVMPHDLLHTSPHVILLCHTVLSRLAMCYANSRDVYICSTSGWMDCGVPRSVHQYQCLRSREARVLERQQSSRMSTSRHKGDRGVAPVPLAWESVGQSHQLERIEKRCMASCAGYGIYV